MPLARRCQRPSIVLQPDDVWLKYENQSRGATHEHGVCRYGFPSSHIPTFSGAEWVDVRRRPPASDRDRGICRRCRRLICTYPLLTSHPATTALACVRAVWHNPMHVRVTRRSHPA